MPGSTPNLDDKPAPPSREAEIAARPACCCHDQELHGAACCAAERISLLAQLQQARDALDHYGQHRPDCPTVDEDGNFHPVPCTCGLDAALMGKGR